VQTFLKSPHLYIPKPKRRGNIRQRSKNKIATAPVAAAADRQTSGTPPARPAAASPDAP
jgi:hypothetical protein